MKGDLWGRWDIDVTGEKTGVIYLVRLHKHKDSDQYGEPEKIDVAKMQLVLNPSFSDALQYSTETDTLNKLVRSHFPGMRNLEEFWQSTIMNYTDVADPKMRFTHLAGERTAALTNMILLTPATVPLGKIRYDKDIPYTDEFLQGLNAMYLDLIGGPLK